MFELVDFIINYWPLFVAIFIMYKCDMKAWILFGLLLHMAFGYSVVLWGLIIVIAGIDYGFKRAMIYADKKEKKTKQINEPDDPDYD